MNRRSFLAMSVLATVAGATPETAQSQADDWASFNGLASVFLSLIEATDPIADFIEKRRFIRFLNGVDETLGEILNSKRDIYFALNSADCSNEGSTPDGAAEEAHSLSLLLEILQAKIETLSICIKPSAIRNDASDVADRMSSIRGGKAWISRVDDYCRMSPGEQRSRFLQEIRDSTDIVSAAQRQLGDLLTKLDQ